MRVAVIALVIALNAALVLGCANPPQWSSCCDANCILQGEQVTSDVPKIGQNFTITLTGKLSQLVNDGGISSSVKWNGFPVANTNGPFCDNVASTKPCPWAAGDLTLNLVKTLTSDTPAGCYDDKIEAINAAGVRIMCISGQFELTSAVQK